jgi:hypothetical protein
MKNEVTNPKPQTRKDTTMERTFSPCPVCGTQFSQHGMGRHIKSHTSPATKPVPPQVPALPGVTPLGLPGDRVLRTTITSTPPAASRPNKYGLAVGDRIAFVHPVYGHRWTAVIRRLDSLSVVISYVDAETGIVEEKKHRVGWTSFTKDLETMAVPKFPRTNTSSSKERGGNVK